MMKNNCEECKKLTGGLCENCFYFQKTINQSDKIDKILGYLFLLNEKIDSISSKVDYIYNKD